MRGSVTRVLRKSACGFILCEDGCEVYFNGASLNGLGIDDIEVGYWVEFELAYGGARTHAMNIRRLRSGNTRFSIAPQCG